MRKINFKKTSLENGKNNSNIKMLAGVLLIGVLSRWLPHPPNLTAVGAIALFSGAFFAEAGLVLLIPILVLFISDLVLGFHSTMIYVYGSVLLISLLGNFFLKKESYKSLVIYSFVSALLFFIVTNFGVWLSMDFYPRNLSGLLSAYIAAIPFFGNTLVGHVFYSLVLFTFGNKVVLSSRKNSMKYVG